MPLLCLASVYFHSWLVILDAFYSIVCLLTSPGAVACVLSCICKHIYTHWINACNTSIHIKESSVLHFKQTDTTQRKWEWFMWSLTKETQQQFLSLVMPCDSWHLPSVQHWWGGALNLHDSHDSFVRTGSVYRWSVKLVLMLFNTEVNYSAILFCTSKILKLRDF